MTNCFKLRLLSSTQSHDCNVVRHFIGADESGSFGILPDHERFITAVEFGLSRYQTDKDQWVFIASPGGVIYFSENILHFSTRRYFLSEDYVSISTLLQQQLSEEGKSLIEIQQSLRNMEQAMLSRIWKMGKNVDVSL